jgi:HEAT repeat protein
VTVLRDLAKEAEANAAIAKDVARFGVKIESPWDFVGQSSLEKTILELKDPRIMEVLASHLNNKHPYVVLEGVIFALGKPEARPFAFNRLLSLILQHGEDPTGQSAAHALNKMLLPQDSEILSDLIMNPTLRHAAGLFVDPYVKLKRKAAIPVLRKALFSQFNGPKLQAAKALSKLNDQESRPELQKMAQSSDPDLRRAGKEAIKHLDKKLSKAT